MATKNRFALFVSLLLLFGCGSGEDSEKPKTPKDISMFRGHEDVEVAPGKWITIGRNDKTVDDKITGFKDGIKRIISDITSGSEWTHIGIPWNNRFIEWKGAPIPFCLREYEGKLYMIGFDRETLNKSRFRYYRENENTLEEIKAADFPQKIATQNMWFREHWDWGEDGAIDKIQLEIDLDPTKKYFNELTSGVWTCLMTGKEYHEVTGYYSTVTYEEKKKLLIEYVQKYEPIKLTQIVKVKQKPPVRKDLQGNPIEEPVNSKESSLENLDKLDE